MPRKPSPPPNADDPEQSKRFIEIAKEAGADGSADEFERAVKRVAAEKPGRSIAKSPQSRGNA